MSQPTLDDFAYAAPSFPRRLAGSVFDRRNLPLAATVLVCGGMYAYAARHYPHFADAQTALNFVGSANAFWGITAVGMSFVILTGGIDLSVRAVIALSSLLVAELVQTWTVRGHHFHPFVAIPIVLMIGTLFGAGQGALVRFFSIPPFLATLGGLFLARGVGLVISAEQVAIDHPLYADVLSDAGVTVGHDVHATPIRLSLQGIIFLSVLAVGIVVAKFTRFGRACYAVGGNEQSATLMGLPVGRTKISVYAISGFCAALAGVVYTFDNQNGNANAAVGLELDVIAAVVVGGTLLAGGSGSILGTLFGFLTFVILSTAILFDGRLLPQWNRIFVGGLLLAFLLLQKGIQRGRGKA